MFPQKNNAFELPIAAFFDKFFSELERSFTACNFLYNFNERTLIFTRAVA